MYDDWDNIQSDRDTDDREELNDELLEADHDEGRCDPECCVYHALEEEEAYREEQEEAA